MTIFVCDQSPYKKWCMSPKIGWEIAMDQSVVVGTQIICIIQSLHNSEEKLINCFTELIIGIDGY